MGKTDRISGDLDEGGSWPPAPWCGGGQQPLHRSRAISSTRVVARRFVVPPGERDTAGLTALRARQGSEISI